MTKSDEVEKCAISMLTVVCLPEKNSLFFIAKSDGVDKCAISMLTIIYQPEKNC